jgi:Tfp pilus assembly protein PilZ
MVAYELYCPTFWKGDMDPPERRSETQAMHIIKVRFRSLTDFQKHYDPELPNGGLFSPTTTHFEPGDEIVLELNVDGLPNKVMIRGLVKWWRPALPRLRVRAGALVEFAPEEQAKRDFVKAYLEGTPKAARKRRHTRLPVHIPVRYRRAEVADFREAGLSEISIGGALLRTDEVLEIGSEVIIELTSPGGSVPVPIAGKVTYRTDTDGLGIKFMYRDGGGSRRIREVIRRIKAYG